MIINERQKTLCNFALKLNNVRFTTKCKWMGLFFLPPPFYRIFKIQPTGGGDILNDTYPLLLNQ